MMHYWTMPGLKRRLLNAGYAANEIIDLTTDHFNMSFLRLINKTRKREVVLARQTTMFLLRQNTKMTFSEIGNLMGSRDHTTVIHSINTIKELREVYPEIEQNIIEITEKLNK